MALLNNRRVFDWLSNNGVIKGNIVEFSEKPISSIPFRAIDWDNKKEVLLHDEIVELCKNNIKDDNYLLRLNNKINELFK